VVISLWRRVSLMVGDLSPKRFKQYGDSRLVPVYRRKLKNNRVKHKLKKSNLSVAFLFFILHPEVGDIFITVGQAQRDLRSTSLLNIV
jgi:hypothetical protein